MIGELACLKRGVNPQPSVNLGSIRRCSLFLFVACVFAAVMDSPTDLVFGRVSGRDMDS
jgi:hypothetical protein